MMDFRPYQRKAIDGITEYFRHKDGNPLVVMPTGCHAAGTKILMFDGSIKSVEDIVVGDQLMGPDSKPRTVLRLARGNEPLYRITPKKGDPFIVNEGHILSLQATNEGRKCARWSGYKSGHEIENVTVRDWLSWSNSKMHIYKLRRVGVDFSHRQELDFPAWHMGIFLGDGSMIYQPSVTTADHEIASGLAEIATMFDVQLKISRKPNNAALSYTFPQKEWTRSTPNPMATALKNAGVWGKCSATKFIPDAYKLGSRQIRLDILAGILDADGSLDKCGTFDYISQSERLADDVVFISRSLGLAAYKKPCQKRDQHGVGGTYYRVCISGHVEIIPTRVARKKALPRNQIKNVLKTGFSAHLIGNGDFYGFSLDGDHLYLTSDFTVHHNTGKSVVIAGFVKETLEAWPDTRILMLTHVKELITQNFAAMIRTWREAPAGIYSAGLNKRDIGAQVLFAGIQSIAKKAYHVQRCDLVLIDEAHLISRKDGSMYKQFLDDLKTINPMLKVIGFTATPYRMDSGKLHTGKDRIFTDIAVNVPILEMFEQGYLSPVTTSPTDTVLDVTGVGSRGGDFIQGNLERAVMAKDNTARAVREIVALGATRGSWLCFCVGVDHAMQVRDAIRAHGIDCETVTGGTPAGERDRILRAFKNGSLRAITNANVLTTGFDAPGVDLIAALRPTQSKGLYVQIIGRGTRLAPGKEDCLVLDFAGNVARHGPIDKIEGDEKSGEKAGDGDAPTKDCPDCGEENAAGRRTCVSCGFEFPAPEPEIDEKATDAAIISTQAVPVWVDVDSVSYRKHQKIGKPPSLEVTYFSGVTRHRDWICFEHTGYPREKAAWWWKLHSDAPLPNTVDEAIAASNDLPRPTAIQVKPVGKYSEIQRHRFV